MAQAVAFSLLHVLQKFVDKRSIPYPRSEFKALWDEVCFLTSSLLQENHEPSTTTPRLGPDLEKQMIDAMYEAEDIVESRMVTHLLPSPEYGNYEGPEEISAEKLLKVLRKLRSIKEKALKVADRGTSEKYPSHDQPTVSSPFLEGNKKFVGREDDLMKIRDQLILESTSKLKVVAVMGMIGVGKSALVNEVYNDPLVGNTFDYQAWVLVGPRNGVREILLSLVSPDEPYPEFSTDELAIRLGKTLSGRRYLIVLDDIRDVETLSSLRTLLPEENNRSCVVLTTRLRDFFFHTSNSFKDFHQIRFLTEDESWNLLRYVAFGEEKSCPFQLVKIGKTIAQACEGLPLKIMVLGSLLAGISPNPEAWREFADDREMQNREMMKVTQDLHNEHVPQHVKACFLYMAAFPQYQHIPISKLFKLWIAEGFLDRFNKVFTPEQFAESCYGDLFLRNLVVCRTWRSMGGSKTCSVHSAIWPFYDHEAVDYNIFQSIKSWKDTAGPSHRRFSIHNNVLFGIKDVYDSISSVSSTRSLLCSGPYHPYPSKRMNFASFRLLKVLDALSVRFFKFPTEILKLVLLRFIALTLGRGEIPALVSNLVQLQFLIVRLHSSIRSSGAPSFLPMDIWNMKELRHLQVMGSDLPAPPINTNALLPNLSTLSDVSTLSCTKEILERIPNLKKLGIRVESSWDEAAVPPLQIFDHLDHIRPLERFKYVVTNPVSFPVLPDLHLTFPLGIKKLTLSGCGFSWGNMREIARLPNLEVLKLRLNAFRGPEWAMQEDKLRKLRYLLLEDLDLEHWRADDTNFPLLERLVVLDCYKLHEIPLGLGEGIALQRIQLVDCNASAAYSAVLINEKQKGLVRDMWLGVLTHLSWIGNT